MEKSGRGGATAAVAEYVQRAGCRRQSLLAHFSERRGPCNSAEGEQLCDYCQDPRGVTAKLASLEEKLNVAAVAARVAEAAGSRYTQGNIASSVGSVHEDPYDRADPGSDRECEVENDQSTTSRRPKTTAVTPNTNESNAAFRALAPTTNPPPASGNAKNIAFTIKRKPPGVTLMSSKMLEAVIKGEKHVSESSINDVNNMEISASETALPKPKRRAFNAPRRVKIPEK